MRWVVQDIGKTHLCEDDAGAWRPAAAPDGLVHAHRGADLAAFMAALEVSYAWQRAAVVAAGGGGGGADDEPE